jgi:hypothetical protein
MRAKRVSSMDLKTIELKSRLLPHIFSRSATVLDAGGRNEILSPTSEDLDLSLQIPGMRRHRTIHGRKSTRPQHGRASGAGALTSRRSKPSISDDESSSDDDRCSSKDEPRCSHTSKHSRWSDLDEQRLLAYKKEGKSWE